MHSYIPIPTYPLSMKLPFTDAHTETDSDNGVVSVRFALSEIKANFKGSVWKLLKCDEHFFLICIRQT
jgi:hypothetical protein